MINRWWDIDAFVLPLKSLAAHRHEVEIIYSLRFTKTITADWHTRVTAAGIDPRRCKHGRFFRGIGASGFDTYVFFPQVPVNRSRKMSAPAIRTRCFITKGEQRFFTDEILLPALRD